LGLSFTSLLESKGKKKREDIEVGGNGATRAMEKRIRISAKQKEKKEGRLGPQKTMHRDSLHSHWLGGRRGAKREENGCAEKKSKRVRGHEREHFM